MDVANWVLAQSVTTKLIIGVSCGLTLYILFRWFIYCANKAYQQENPKKATRETKIRNLFGQ